ncbi:MAG: hypothetical protein ACR2PL_13120 [Dehalococcoidia bacterium]
METRHGADFWQQAENLFSKDSRMAAWLDFVQRLCVSHTQDAVDGLEDLGSIGFSWPLPSGRVKTERQPDFGFNFIHIVTHRVEGRLAANHSATTAMSATVSIQKTRTIVTVKTQGNQLLLFYQDRQGRRVRGQTKDFLLLFCQDAARHIKDYDAWQTIWPNVSFQRDERGGAHFKLRDLQRRVNHILIRAIGEPPDKSDWVQRLEEYGFALNSSVEWHFRLFEKDRSRIEPRDPSSLNNRESSGR